MAAASQPFADPSRPAPTPRARHARFLVVGEALVDVIHHADGHVTEHPGGSPTNVAVGLARLGHEVRELCYLGQDPYGDAVRAHLRAAGVQEDPGALVAPATSVADVRLDVHGDAHYDFSVLWDTPTEIDWSPAGDAIDVVHAGSIALALEPGAERVLSLLRGRPEGVRVTIDPNVRPAFLSRDGAAERIEPFLALADLVKLSDEDADFLYPGVPIPAVLDRVLDLGATIAAITRGARGAVLATADTVVEVPATAPRVVDTVGAGDSFMAALISVVSDADGWRPGRADLERFARFAARASAITVSREGPDLPSRAEVDAAD
jgi:fructokinase